MKRGIFASLLVVFLFLSYKGAGNFLPEEDQLNIYPNPAGSDLTVKIELEQSSTTHLRIIDLTGKVVKDASREFTFEHGIYKAKLDISKLQSGIYFVRVEQADKVYTKKLVVR